MQLLHNTICLSPRLFVVCPWGGCFLLECPLRLRRFCPHYRQYSKYSKYSMCHRAPRLEVRGSRTTCQHEPLAHNPITRSTIANREREETQNQTRRLLVAGLRVCRLVAENGKIEHEPAPRDATSPIITMSYVH